MIVNPEIAEEEARIEENDPMRGRTFSRSMVTKSPRWTTNAKFVAPGDIPSEGMNPEELLIAEKDHKELF